MIPPAFSCLRISGRKDIATMDTHYGKGDHSAGGMDSDTDDNHLGCSMVVANRGHDGGDDHRTTRLSPDCFHIADGSHVVCALLHSVPSKTNRQAAVRPGAFSSIRTSYRPPLTRGRALSTILLAVRFFPYQHHAGGKVAVGVFPSDRSNRALHTGERPREEVYDGSVLRTASAAASPPCTQSAIPTPR